MLKGKVTVRTTTINTLVHTLPGIKPVTIQAQYDIPTN